MGFSVGLFIAWVIILILLLASFLVSASEIAFFDLRKQEFKNLRYGGGRVQRIIIRLMGQPESLLATILIVNNFIHVLLVILAAWIGYQWMVFSDPAVWVMILLAIGLTMIILLVGEVLPRVYATRHSLRIARLMALPIYVLRVLCKPLAAILIRSTSRVQQKLKEKKANLSLNDLSQALDLSGEPMEEDERILKGIVNFGNTDVREVMKSRVDVVAVDLTTSFAELISTIQETGYSRIPVYIKDFDHVKGVLYVKDLLPHIGKPSSFRWQSLIRPPYFVPGNKKINDLLTEFQKNKIHLALVVDEYGGTSGLITLEDILEEIVGEISDESDEEENLFKRINDHTFDFEGKVMLNDFCRALDIPEDSFDSVRGEAETLAGLILEFKGGIPEKGDQFRYQDLQFEVRQVDERRILMIRVNIRHE